MKQKLAIHQLRNLSRSRRKQTHKISRVEQSIITVQQYFLSPGLHCITVPNLDNGRSLLRICLDSLGIYTNVGMLSLSNKAVPAHYVDLYADMQRAHVLSLDSGMLEEYMLSSFQADFLILEYTQELMEQPWFGRFEHLLHDYSIATSIPVIMFLYEEQSLEHN